MNNLNEIEQIIGYTFKDKSLLQQAFTHSSHNSDSNYERLEFLGDSLLNYAVSHELFKNINADAGKLTEFRKGIVSKEPLAEIIEELELDKYIILGNGLTLTGLAGKKISDIFESLTAAIMLDGGFEAANDFIRRMFGARLESPSPYIDYKSKLNEYCAQNNLECNYTDSEDNGEFTTTLLIGGKKAAEASAKRKNTAQKLAAKNALEILQNHK